MLSPFCFVEERGILGDGFFRIDDGGQRIVIHFNQIDCIARGVAIGCHDHGNWLADEAHFIDGQHGTGGGLHFRQHGGANHVADYAARTLTRERQPRRREQCGLSRRRRI